MNAVVTKITEEEEQLYDRQIRLWGMESQNRLRNAKVLIIGVNNLSCEVIKNLVLTGINTIGLCDEQNTTEEDVSNNFLISHDSVGVNRAKAAKMRTEELNPRVTVQIYDTMPIEIDNFQNNGDGKFSLESFDIIICCLSKVKSRPENLWLVVNEACRKLSRYFFAMDSFGWHGLTFIDLGDSYRFLCELTDQNKKDTNGTATLVANVKDFYSLDHILRDIDWKSDHYQKLLRRMPKNQFLLLVLQQFCSEYGRYAQCQDRDALIKTWKRFANQRNLDTNLISNSSFDECFGPGAVPVNAVLGGLVSQEIIKAISAKNEPVGNFVLLNGVTCAADATFLQLSKDQTVG